MHAQCPDGSPPPCAGAARLRRVQVVPFEAADSTVAHVASALADDIMAGLRSSGGVAVIHGGGTRGAEYVLTGRVAPTADGFEVAARLEQPTSGRVAWSTRLARLRRALPGTSHDLTAGVLRAIGLHGAAAPVTPFSVNPQVYDLVLRARYQLNRRTEPTVARAGALLHQAIALDSNAAIGWVWLTRYYFYARFWALPIADAPTADSALRLEVQASERATELDPTSAMVWLARAQVAEDVAPADRGPAIAALRRAVTIDPGLADAWRLLGSALEETGDSAGAGSALRRAVTLAPDEGEYLMWIGLHAMWHRDYDAAAKWADSAVAMDPTLPGARSTVAQVALWRGRLAEAESQTAALERLGDPDFIGFAHDVHNRMARGDTAGARAAQEARRARLSRTPAAHAVLAAADGEAALGNVDAAIALLEGYAGRDDAHFLMHVRLERGFDPLRSSPRFRALFRTP